MIFHCIVFDRLRQDLVKKNSLQIIVILLVLWCVKSSLIQFRLFFILRQHSWIHSWNASTGNQIQKLLMSKMLVQITSFVQGVMFWCLFEHRKHSMLILKSFLNMCLSFWSGHSKLFRSQGIPQLNLSDNVNVSLFILGKSGNVQFGLSFSRQIYFYEQLDGQKGKTNQFNEICKKQCNYQN